MFVLVALISGQISFWYYLPYFLHDVYLTFEVLFERGVYGNKDASEILFCLENITVSSLFYVYKIILVVTFIDDFCFGVRLILISARCFKSIAINNIVII